MANLKSRSKTWKEWKNFVIAIVLILLVSIIALCVRKIDREIHQQKWQNEAETEWV